MVLYNYKSYKDNDLIFNIVAPGHKKEDFKIELVDKLITIYLEDYFTESYRLPEEINSNKIKAEYDAGILKIKFKKEKPKLINIE